MGTILRFLKGDSGTFEPEVVHAMSCAFDEASAALSVQGDPRAQDTVALRIIELARRGEHDARRLRERVLREFGAPALTKLPEEVPSMWFLK